MEQLFKQGQLGAHTISNRFVAQPMESNCALPGGNVSDLCLKKYKQQAQGKWGVIIVEAISVTSTSLARKNALIMNRKNLDGFKRLVETIKQTNHEAKVLFQITHSGPVSNNLFSEKVCATPNGEGRYLLTTEVDKIKHDFVDCCLLSEEAGADGIDFKICHGYLGGELLRPTNTRPDKFGGSWENRTRFLCEGIGEIIQGRKNKGFILGSRFSMYEGIRGGCGTASPDEIIEDLSEMKQLIQLMSELGMDYINVSSGIPAKTSIITRPVQTAELMYLHHLRYTRFAKESLNSIRSNTKVIGSAYSVMQERALPIACEMLEKGYADFIGWGRQTLADSLLPLKLMNSEKVDYCTSCSGCSKMMIKQINVGCIIFDNYYKQYWHEQK